MGSDLIVTFMMLLIVCLLFVSVAVWLRSNMTSINGEIKQMFGYYEQIVKNLASLQKIIRDEEIKSRDEISRLLLYNREEMSNAQKNLQEVLLANSSHINNLEKNQFDSFTRQMEGYMQLSEKSLDQMRNTLATRLQNLNESTAQELKLMANSLQQKLEQMRENLEGKVHIMQQDNNEKLEQMRIVVDEKLHRTLEQRLGESFKQVSDRLESVHKGLGEMQTLAAGVGDLKKVLTNVKTRGTWGEVQLGALLEDILTPDQFEKNVAIKKGAERVEFAIRMPGQDYSEGIWLPIDAKFPVEDYYRLLDAHELADSNQIEAATKALENRIKAQAKEIQSKYVEPPLTTDFAIMFLPTESLYAEVLRIPGLFEATRRDYNVVLAGPTTLSAIVNSLAVGFRTLAIQKRSSEVWQVLGAVKTEFAKFGAALEKTQKKILEASNTIEDATKRSRIMERKLKTVEALPERQIELILNDDYTDSDLASAASDYFSQEIEQELNGSMIV